MKRNVDRRKSGGEEILIFVRVKEEPFEKEKNVGRGNVYGEIHTRKTINL